ncbi:MAG: hypothetical protein RIT81_00890 [Deltaproteobacteria bacterium]
MASSNPPTVATAFEAGALRWTTIDLAASTFERLAGPHIRAADDEIYAEDLYLAAACVDGHPEAIAAFEGELLPLVARALRPMRGAPDDVEEVLQALRAKVLVDGGDGTPKLAAYAGRGPLAAWLRITGVRLYLELLRQRGRQPLADDDALADGLVAAGPDPALALIQRTYRADFERAFDEAIAELSAQDKNLLRYRFVDALSMAAICKITQQHRATVHRKLASVCAKLAHRIDQLLSGRLGVPRHELESIRRLIRSQLSLSLARRLAD